MVNDAPFGYVYLSRKVYPIRYKALESGYMGRKVGLEPTTHEGGEPSCSDQLSYLRWVKILKTCKIITTKVIVETGSSKLQKTSAVFND